MTDKEVRKANSVAELELLFTIGALYIVDYYDKRPILRFLVRLGFEGQNVKNSCMDRTQRELSDVDYDYESWRIKYGKILLKK